MSVSRQDFDMQAGTAKQLNFTLTNAGTPLDLSSATLIWRMAASINGAAILQKGNVNPDSGITVTGPGQCTVSIGNDDVPDGGLYWHFLDVMIAGSRTPLARGRGVVAPAIGPVES